MRLNGSHALVAAAVAAGLTAVAWSGAATSRQATCSASDTACRLDRIEASLARIERSLGTGGGSGAGAAGSPGVAVATEDRCYAGYDCRSTASAVCTSSGFSRGVPSAIEDRSGTRYMTQATCLGPAGSAGPATGGVTLAAYERCYAGYDCQSTATATCTNAGFARGVPAAFEDRSGTRYMTRATCLD